MITPEQAALLKAAYGRKHKFGAKRTEVDGVSFASKREAERYAELKLLERAGAIKNLRLQPRYPLTVNGAFICTFVGDFEFVERRDEIGPPSKGSFAACSYAPRWVLTCEDVKGFENPAWKIKWAHAKAEYRAIEFRIVK